MCVYRISHRFQIYMPLTIELSYLRHQTAVPDGLWSFVECGVNLLAPVERHADDADAHNSGIVFGTVAAAAETALVQSANGDDGGRMTGDKAPDSASEHVFDVLGFAAKMRYDVRESCVKVQKCNLYLYIFCVRFGGCVFCVASTTLES